MPLAPRALLIILDGWGLGPDPSVDALAQAKTPRFDELMATYPHATLTTFGGLVGLPEGQMGNSEVGHLNIGAGRVVYQDFARINKAVRDGEFAKNPVLQEAFAKTKAADSTLHLMGLVSDGGVHSHISHLLALCDAAAAAGLKKVYVHAFTDGRDTDPHGAAGYLKTLQDHIAGQPARLATVTGRYYAMDRDRRWERTKVAYDALVHGTGELTGDPLGVLQQRYADEQTDEFIKPIVVQGADGQPLATLGDGDTVVFFNFRTDRPRQLTDALTQTAFPVQRMRPLRLNYVTMTGYDESFTGLHVMYTKDNLRATLGEVLAKAGKTQLRIAETEKYPHVTFFFNGGREAPFAGEERIIVPSPKVATYDLQPEMSAYEVRDKAISHIQSERPDFIALNFANTDMVGHTGVWEAALRAAETVDACLGNLLDVAHEADYAAIVIADHGNSDVMRNPDGSPNTAHTVSPVPVIYVPAGGDKHTLHVGKLGDIAPTILELLGLEAPVEMDGQSLLNA